MSDKNSHKKNVGDLSVKYLKFLFLKTRKKEIPELEDDFRNRRYFEDNFEENDEEIIDVRPKKSKILPDLKKYIIRRLEEEDFKEQEVDEFIEENTARKPTKRTRRLSKRDDLFDDYEYEDDIDYLETDDYLLDDDDDFLEDIQPKKTNKISRRSASKDNNDDLDDFLNKYK